VYKPVSGDFERRRVRATLPAPPDVLYFPIRFSTGGLEGRLRGFVNATLLSR
jgi:hypothetical protein